MARRRSKLLGLALIGTAAVLCWQRWRARSADRGGTETVTAPKGPRPPLTVVARDPEPEPSTDPAGEPSAVPAWRGPVDGACPDGYPVKVNERSGIFHVPGGLSYDRTRPTRCYRDAESAEADGFRQAKR